MCLKALSIESAGIHQFVEPCCYRFLDPTGPSGCNSSSCHKILTVTMDLHFEVAQARVQILQLRQDVNTLIEKVHKLECSATNLHM